MRDLIENIKNKNNTETKSSFDAAIRQAFAEFQLPRANFSTKGLLDDVVTKVVEFLDLHVEYLPMYATPAESEKTLPATKPQSEYYDTTCCHFGILERGYYLPYTIPIQGEDVECLVSNPELSNTAQHQRDTVVVMTCPGTENFGELQETYFYKPGTRGIIKSLREKKKSVATYEDITDENSD